MSPSELEKTAYHESGHAVMAFLKKVRILQVSVIPDDSVGILGVLVKSNKIEIESNQTKQKEVFLNRLENFILVAMAGMVAEFIITGIRNYKGAVQDITYIQDLLARITYSQKEKELYEDMLWARTSFILREEGNWKMVKTLATHLLNKSPTLTGKQTLEILRKANWNIDKQNIQNISDSLNRK